MTFQKITTVNGYDIFRHDGDNFFAVSAGTDPNSPYAHVLFSHASYDTVLHFVTGQYIPPIQQQQSFDTSNIDIARKWGYKV